MSRRPYVRELPKTTWWLSHGRYKRYIAREVTCIFIGLYTAVLVFGIKRLSEGEAAYQGFLDTLNHPLFVLFHLLALGFSTYNSISWFSVTPKAMRIQIGDSCAPDAVVSGAHYAAWLVVSLLILFMAGM